MVLSESRLKSCIKDSEVAINGFNLFRIDRSDRSGGGVAIFVKSALTVSILHAATIPKCFEFIALKIVCGRNDSFVVVGVYRPPNALANSVDMIFSLLSAYNNSELLILGDFNLNWLSRASDYLKDISCDINLSQLIKEPTRPNMKNLSRSTLIDLIFSNRCS